MKFDKRKKPNVHAMKNGDVPKPSQNDSLQALLQREAYDSHDGMLRSVLAMKSDFRSGFRPKVVVRSHPWLTAGTVAATGFAVASAIMSRFKKSPNDACQGRPASFSPTGGLAAVGLAVLTRVLQSSSAAALPAVLGTVADLWQAKRRPSPCRDTNGTERGRS